jgi:sulfate permease, SulP family
MPFKEAKPTTGDPGRVSQYLRGDLRSDAVAGLTVAVMGVPQAMAYALIAGLPPVYGLYTAIVTCAVAALLGSSRHLVTGPTNALCMVILSLTAHLPARYGISMVEAALLLTFMTGLIQLGFGVLRLGLIVRYISHSVIIGFTAGAGILIAGNQIKNILGIDISGEGAVRFHEVLLATARNLADTNPYALIIGAVTAAILLFAPRLHRRLPAALLGLVVAGLACYLLGWHQSDMGAMRVQIVRDIDPIQGGLAIFHLPELLLHPNWELTRSLGMGSLALALLGLIEAASISRAVATSTGQRLNFTREFIGQGAANMVGSLFSCFAGSGSFTRTALCFQSGGRTRMAATFSALWTTLALVLCGPIANQIPKPALAAILMVIAFSMVEKRRLKASWNSGRSPRLVMIGTLVSTLVLPLEYAIFVGVFLSVVILLRTTSKIDLTQLVPLGNSGFDELPFNRAAPSPVVTVNMEGDLYFAAAEDLDYDMMRCLRPETCVVVLRMKRLRAVGSSAMAMLDHFWTVLNRRNIRLVVCGIEDELIEVMTGSGLRERIGEQNIFYADNKLFQSTELALARAWSIVETHRHGDASIEGEPADDRRRQLAARDLMSARGIRFGNQHQLREALWLMSELHRHTSSISPEPLFLQDREGRLAGEISSWRLLEALTAKVEDADAGTLDDEALGELMRRDFTQPIGPIARHDPIHRTDGDRLVELLETSVEKNLLVIPICDSERRVTGLVKSDDLLRGLTETLRAAEDPVEGTEERND